MNQMNAGACAAKQGCFSFVSLGLILLWTFLGTLGMRSYAAAPILDQLPANLDQRPRLDMAGNIIDAHDGMITQFGDRYYLYGTSYEQTTGWLRGQETILYTNHYQCYTSTDLVNW